MPSESSSRATVIVVAVLGDLIVVTGVAWYIWRELADACVKDGGRVVAAACERADGTIVPFREMLDSPVHLTLIAFAIFAVLGSAVRIVRATRRVS